MCRDFVIFSKIDFLDEQKTKRRPIFRKRSPEIQVLGLLQETYFSALFILIAFLSSVTLPLVSRNSQLRTPKIDPLTYLSKCEPCGPLIRWMMVILHLTPAPNPWVGPPTLHQPRTSLLAHICSNLKGRGRGCRGQKSLKMRERAPKYSRKTIKSLEIFEAHMKITNEMVGTLISPFPTSQ